MDYCPQCGEDTEEFFEGYCKHCRDENQRALDEHNGRFDWWQSLSDRERDEQIKNAK